MIVEQTGADQSQGTQMDEFTRANELCSQASAMAPSEALSEQLSELHIQINDALVELDTAAREDNTTADGDTLAIMNQTPNQTQNQSIYGTPSEYTSFNRRSYFSPSSKQVSSLFFVLCFFLPILTVNVRISKNNASQES